MSRRPSDAQIEHSMQELLDRRAPKTICPSEVARAVGDESWRDLMEPVRQVAWRLAGEGELEVTQRGEPVEREGLRGPIRLRRPR